MQDGDGNSDLNEPGTATFQTMGEEVKKREKNAIVAYVTAGLIMLSTALLTPSLWLYLEALSADSPLWLGLIVSAYALGVIVGSVFFGHRYGRQQARSGLAQQQQQQQRGSNLRSRPTLGSTSLRPRGRRRRRRSGSEDEDEEGGNSVVLEDTDDDCSPGDPADGIEVAPDDGGAEPHEVEEITRTTLLHCLGLMVVGNILYPLATLVPNSPAFATAMLLSARFIEGLGASLEVVLVSYFALVSTGVERTRHYTLVKLSGTLATIVGPGISVALSQLGAGDAIIRVDKHTGPGWLALVVTVLCAVLVRLAFSEPRDLPAVSGAGGAAKLLPDQQSATDHASYGSVSVVDDSERPDDVLLGSALPTTHRFVNPFKGLSFREVANLLSFLFLFLALYNSLSVYETVGAVVTQQYYSWDVLENSILWTSIGISSAVGFGLLYAVTHIWPHAPEVDFFSAVVASLCLAAAFAFMVVPSGPLPLWRFLLGTGIVALVFPIAHTTALAAYSKLLPESTEAQGSLLGLFNVFGAAARLIGPLWSSGLYVLGEGPAYVFAVTAGLILLMVLALLVDSRGLLRRIRSVPGAGALL
jgi:MFS family permease